MKTRLAPWLIAGLCMSLLSACSKTVTWQEEVPLNTGEVIWVERSMPWVYKGGFGNPFDMAMRPTGEQTIRFEYGGINYSYTGSANVLWMAISTEKKPVLVARAADFGWATANSYTCVTPYYVQLVPDTTGKNWTWPEKIDPWLYQLEVNLIANWPKLDEMSENKFLTIDRSQRNSTFCLQSACRIDPTYNASSGCVHKYDPSMKPNWSTK